ncbi:DNA repair helicase XPB [Paenibacillus oceani]|uniref:DNA 3'-5' helicase n=1 Tax=Paenibacillus oceani TaxID=2772510 RepID=A0A927H0L7_9BACL|nr:DNA repair helicase XPB [Paenibacillus oceani]MBD2862609.1 helicase-associated domain-containing protein [Paenibacillus oceani]
MRYDPQRPLVVQSDSTMLLEADHTLSEETAASISRFAELVKTPGHIHTYRMTPLSLWNAASSGMDAEQILDVLNRYGKFDVPLQARQNIIHFVSRYGLVKLRLDGQKLLLVSDEPGLLDKLAGYKSLQTYFIGGGASEGLEVAAAYRGMIKQDLIRLGFPVQDVAGYHHGERLPIRLKDVSASGDAFILRDYQKAAVDAFYDGIGQHGGSGVVVLPCGAGKTVVGIAALARLQCAALILTTNVASVRQWKRELLSKTDLHEELVGEYGGSRKEVRPVTIATYQILTHRHRKEDGFSHMSLFSERDWGLIVYDEVHLLPAPVFRATADIQATRRLGLTATLVREDGREEDVFSLVGPKLYEAGWKDLEHKGWVSKVQCTELRVPMPERIRESYVRAESRSKHRIAGENPLKLQVLRDVLERHRDDQTLVIGQYLDQLKRISADLNAPMISGEMPHEERDGLYARFNRGEIRTLVVSKVANFAIDLPDARVAIQVSGSFGSRQEEAQRLGRILRPKVEDNRAFFYSLVSDDTREQEFSVHRQLFLLEQGYRYEIRKAEALQAAEMEEEGAT